MIPAAIFVGIIFLVFGGASILIGLITVLVQVVFSALVCLASIAAFIVQFIINPKKGIAQWKASA